MLNFVRMELRGFKSFADKVVIPFNEGVTAIIGPNGCGKSNVAEAIRWTLGEKSAKQLRGKRMTDVIFAGTEKRRSMSYCEVTLVFNNSNDHIFPGLGLEEVSVTRKLDRSGTSEYFINNNRCKWQDVVDLFNDTGAGKEGYSIIGQGKVAEIMSVKPDERRHIFEEAAEISGIRSSRADSERKLEKAKLNMQTANEVIAEIERRIGPLKKQAETAQKCAALKSELKTLEVNYYIYNYEHNQSIKQNIRNRINASREALDRKETEYKICCKKYDDSIILSNGMDRLLEEHHAELTALKVAATKLEGDAKYVKELIRSAQQEINTLNDNIASVDDQLIETDKLIAASKQESEDKFALYLQKTGDVSALDERYKALSASVEGQEEDAEARNREYMRLIDELSELKANSASYIAEKGIQSERLKTISANLAESKADLDAAKTELAIADGKLSSSKQRMRELVERYNETFSDKSDALEAKKSYNEDILKLNAELGLAQGNLSIYRQNKEQYLGYQEGLQHLMYDAKTDPELAGKIWGVLAEVIKVPDEYVTAIDCALGNAMQNVLCADEHDASDLINYLKRKSYGRVTFRPYSACRISKLEGRSLGVLNEPGCRGLASDVVQCDKKFEPFIKALLGSTVIVNNLDNAKLLYRKYDRAFRIVTLGGEIFTRTGEVTGGSKRSQYKSLLAQEQNIAAAEATVEKIRSHISTMQARIVDNDAAITKCDEELEKISAEMSELKIEIGLSESKIAQCTEAVEKLDAHIADLSEEYEKVSAAVLEIEEKLSSIDKLEKLASEKKEEFSGLYEESRSQGTQQRSERQEVQEKLIQARIEAASIGGDLDRLKNDIARYERRRTELESEKIDLAAALKQKMKELEDIEAQAEGAVLSESDAARLEELERGIAELNERKRTISDEIKDLDAQKSRLFEEKNALTVDIARDEAMLDGVDIEIRAQQEHIVEEYDLTYSTALDLKQEDFDPEAAPAAINDLKKAIARLGDVNPLAVEDLKQTEERLAEQIAIRDDVQKAYNDLINIITNITEEMREKFTTAFNKINENFKVLFRQLFGGGNGELKLNKNDSEDVLEQGIEIFAQPPGKNLQNISLLSGGEQALTAIAILFSILKLKPMPFCVLDEIEAALDDGNVDLFAEFLKKFSNYTQFIVITHRKPTMRHADTIFGVTMEEKGVTKIVSVEFEEAQKQAGVQ